ncbi:MAG: biotin synthase BioB [Sphingomonadales bacterium]
MLNPDPARHDWTVEQALGLFEKPFLDLLLEAQQLHRAYHPANRVQMAQLLSIKTGGCAEDCAYCPQSAKFAAETGMKAEKLMDVDAVLADARRAKAGGASRYCMGAAWTRPKDRDLDAIEAMIKGVRGLGLETCVTLGMLEPHQARRLADAGLDYYNHNIDTSEEFYGEIITTRNYQDRLDTLGHVRDAGIHVCSGGIVGMGESRADRAGMLVTLANLDPHPESVPVNRLVQVKGTPLHGTPELEELEFVRTIAAARLMMPKSMVRLSAGREDMSDSLQALCFMAGANSIFVGERLLTTPNPGPSRDDALLAKLGLSPMAANPA